MKKHLGTHPKEMEEYLKKQEEIDKKKVATNLKRPAEDEADSKPLKQTRLDFGAKEVTKAKQKDFDDAVVSFVAETGVSFNVLGSESFKELIGVANRQLNVKDPRTYSRKVDGASRSVLSRVSDILSAVKSTIPSVGFTSDMWTSRAQVVVILILQQNLLIHRIVSISELLISQDSYMSLTLSCIDVDWELHRWCPFVKPFPARYAYKKCV